MFTRPSLVLGVVASTLGIAASAQAAATPTTPVTPVVRPAVPTITAPGVIQAAGSFQITALRSAQAEKFLLGAFPITGWIAPDDCRTAPYVAGPGEQALVTSSASVRVPPSHALSVPVRHAVGVAKAGAAMAPTGVWQVDSVRDETAATTATVLVPLEAGVTYRFGTSLHSIAAVDVVESACQVTAMVVRED